MCNKKSLWLFFLLLLSVQFLQAQANRTYILFDPGCMDRMEYKQVGQPGVYTVYQIRVAPGERVLMEVGQEMGEYREMPASLITCSNGTFDSRMVKNINSRMDQVFMVRRLNNGQHTITQVTLASEYRYNESTLAFNSPKYTFRFDFQYGTIGENIAPPKSPKEVLFVGRMEEECLGAYIFRQFTPQGAKPYLDLVFVPEIGIVEERAGLSQDEARNNAMKLDNVNGIALASHVQNLCNSSGPSTLSVNTPLLLQPNSTNRASTATVFEETPDMTLKSIQTEPLQPSVSNGTGGPATMHTIAAGETLYRISRNYGVTVEELKAWNGLKSNTIYKGRQLIVSDPVGAGGPVGYSEDMGIPSQGDALPGLYTERNLNPNVMAKGGSSQKYHTVRTGETVATIAMKYGYTENKFREINGLDTYEYPKIGQQLKTTDCECPAQSSNTESSFTTRSLDPYSPKAVPAPNQPVEPSITRPLNTYSYPSPYGNEGQVNANSRAFSNYNDTPVPATSTRTAPNNYSNNRTGTTTARGIDNYYNRNTSQPDANRTSPSDYSNYGQTNEFSTRSLNTTRNTISFQNSTRKRSHIVQEGESIYDIARRYSMDVQRLRQLNRMDAREQVIPSQRIFLE